MLVDVVVVVVVAEGVVLVGEAASLVHAAKSATAISMLSVRNFLFTMPSVWDGAGA